MRRALTGAHQAYIRGYLSAGGAVARAELQSGSYAMDTAYLTDNGQQLTGSPLDMATQEGVAYRYGYGAFDLGVQAALRPRFFIEPAVGVRVPVTLGLSLSEEETYFSDGVEHSGAGLLTSGAIADNLYAGLLVGSMLRGRPDAEGFHGLHLSVGARAYRWSGTIDDALYRDGEPISFPEAGDLTVDVFAVLGISIPEGS